MASRRMLKWMLLAVVSWPANRKIKELPRISSRVRLGAVDFEVLESGSASA